MKVYLTTGGYWLAEGDGPLRKILAEGATRREAWGAYAACYSNQLYHVRYIRGDA